MATPIPATLEDAITQARAATQAAIAAGMPRILVDFAIPELKIQPVAQQFYPLFQDMGLTFKLYFPDAGAAALAKRDWGNPDFSIRGINEAKGRIEPEDEAFLIVEPSAIEVHEVEAFCNEATGRFVVMLNPKLEDIATIGIGYAGRQLRDRFLSTLDYAYYLQELEAGTLLRCYPSPWQVWGVADGEAEAPLLGEFPLRPNGEQLAKLFAPVGEMSEDGQGGTTAKPKGKGVLAELQGFLRALSR